MIDMDIIYILTMIAKNS